MSTSTLQDVQLDQLHLSMSESQIARREAFKQEDLDDMAESIKKHGVLAQSSDENENDCLHAAEDVITSD